MTPPRATVCEAASKDSYSPSDWLGILADETRHNGPKPWILTALDYLADELEVYGPERGPVPEGNGAAHQ